MHCGICEMGPLLMDPIRQLDSQFSYILVQVQESG